MNTPDSSNEFYLQLSKITATSSSAGNREENWKQHLEKAYFNKQVEVMKSTGPVEPASSSGGVLLHQSVTTQSFINGVTVAAELETRVQTAKVLPTDTAVSPFLRIGHAAHQLMDKSAVQAQPLSGEVKLDRSIKELSKTQFERLLPVDKFPSLFSANKESVQVFLKGEEAHLVIRNDEIEQVEIKRLIEQVKSILREKQLHLSRVIINGDLYWEDKLSQTGTEEELSLKEEGVFMDKVF